MTAPTLAEIKDRVSPAIRATHSSQQVADALNVGRVRIAETRIGEVKLCRTIGGDRGTEVLVQLRQLSTSSGVLPPAMTRKLGFVVKWLDDDELDVGDGEVRESIGLLTPQVVTSDEAG